jgi:hypothetical protein
VELAELMTSLDRIASRTRTSTAPELNSDLRPVFDAVRWLVAHFDEIDSLNDQHIQILEPIISELAPNEIAARNAIMTAIAVAIECAPTVPIDTRPQWVSRFEPGSLTKRFGLPDGYDAGSVVRSAAHVFARMLHTAILHQRRKTSQATGPASLNAPDIDGDSNSHQRDPELQSKPKSINRKVVSTLTDLVEAINETLEAFNSIPKESRITSQPPPSFMYAIDKVCLSLEELLLYKDRDSFGATRIIRAFTGGLFPPDGFRPAESDWPKLERKSTPQLEHIEIAYEAAWRDACSPFWGIPRLSYLLRAKDIAGFLASLLAQIPTDDDLVDQWYEIDAFNLRWNAEEQEKFGVKHVTWGSDEDIWFE